MAASTNYDKIVNVANSQQQGSTTSFTGSTVVITGHGEDATGAATKYLTAPGGNHAAAQVKLLVPTRPCTIMNLYVSATTAAGGTDTGIVTVQKSVDNAANYTDTALTCTITGTTKAGSDTSNRVAIAAGDVLAIKIVSSAGTLAKVTASFEVA